MPSCRGFHRAGLETRPVALAPKEVIASPSRRNREGIKVDLICSHGYLAPNRGAISQPFVRKVIKYGMVLDDAIVPKYDGVRLPLHSELSNDVFSYGFE